MSNTHYLKKCADNLPSKEKEDKVLVVQRNGVKMLNRFYHVDKAGNIMVLNEKGCLIEQSIVLPMYLLFLLWPVLLIYHNNVMFLLL